MVSTPSRDSIDAQSSAESPNIHNPSVKHSNITSNAPVLPPEERYHHPDQPLRRTTFQKLIIWLAQCGFICMGYYYCSHLFGGPMQSLSFIWHPPFLQNLPFQFWSAVLFIAFFTKIFSPTATLCGALIAEWILEISSPYPVQPILLAFLVVIVAVESRLRYQGGEFVRGKRIFQQAGLSVLAILVFLPFIYYLTPFSLFLSDTFTKEDARVYFALLYLSANFIWVPLLAFLLWILDRILIPYFPLTPEEKEALQNSKPSDDVAMDYMNIFIPQPGELYHDLLTHHPLSADNHTIVFYLGKVRIYFCTRCTGTIYGTFFGLFFIEILSLVWNLTLAPITALWLIILLPLFPITDWGLQAIHYRPANTTSRLFTGFILGISIILIQWTRGYEIYMILILVVYFTLFFLLGLKRRKIEEREFNEQNAAFQSKDI